VTSNRAAVGQLILLLIAAVALRLLVLDWEGHNGDVRVTAGWAERMAEVGPLRFYEGSGSIYPALLYPLWGIGALLDGDALNLAIKGLAIPFDVGIGVLLFGSLRWRTGNDLAVLIAGLYLLNPAVILAGPVWGQVDSAGTLPFLGAMVALAARRHGLAGALAVVATLVKPQFGLAVLPVLVLAALRARRFHRLQPLTDAVVGMVLAGLVVLASVALAPWHYLGLLSDTAVRQPETSLHAFNPWGLLVGFGIPDGPYVLIGSVLLAAGVIGSLWGLRRRPDLAVVLAVGALLALAFYFLPTRVHERYLFPAIAVLAPFAPAGRAQLTAFIGLSAGFAAALLFALHETTPFDLPAPWDGWVTSDAGVWVIGLVMIGSAVAWAWLLGVRRPRLPRRPAPDLAS
jgi:dolichyl-phosphate-mannose-protein mannosyltransferase